jgi:peptidoglycan/LPS O-acetylase OafA/YrhL
MADFAVSRIIRLYPAYWFAVLLIGGIYLTTGMGRGKPDQLIPNLTMFQQGMGVQNVSGVFWTLWAEMHFYALVSIMVLAGVTYQRCITFMSSWTVLAIFAYESGNDLLQSVLIPEYAPYFIGGMAFFLIHRFGQSLLLWGFVAFSWACSMRYALPTATDAPYNVAKTDAWPAVVIIITLLYVVMGLVATGKLGWLRWRRFATLGALTYPTYLIHYEVAPPIAHAIYPRMPLWAATALVIAIVLLAAYLIHRLVEVPLSGWLKPRLRDSFARLTAADPGRHRGRRAQEAAQEPVVARTGVAAGATAGAAAGATAESAGDTPSTGESPALTPSARGLTQPGEEPHGSTPSAPIGSTI